MSISEYPTEPRFKDVDVSTTTGKHFTLLEA